MDELSLQSSRYFDSLERLNLDIAIIDNTTQSDLDWFKNICISKFRVLSDLVLPTDAPVVAITDDLPELDLKQHDELEEEDIEVQNSFNARIPIQD